MAMGVTQLGPEDGAASLPRASASDADVAPPVGPTRSTARHRRRRRGRWILWSVAGLVVALVVAGGVGFAVYGKTYQPLGPGDEFGPMSRSMKAITDGIQDTSLIVVGPKGTRASVRLSLANNGPHPVRILPEPGYSADWQGPILTVQWEPSPHGGDPGPGVTPRSLPTTISPHTQILLWVTDIQPGCSGGTYATQVELPIYWSALGWHHKTPLQLGGSSNSFLPIVNCPPAAALRHVDPNG